MPQHTHLTTYTEKDHRAAVIAWLTYGVMSKVSDLLDIPETTLCAWKNDTTWWHVLSEDYRSEISVKIKAEVDETIELAFSEMNDRLRGGDYVVIKDQLIRKPVSARDAGWIAGVMVDKRQVLNNQPTTISGNHMDSKLAETIAALEEVGKRVSERVIEGERLKD